MSTAEPRVLVVEDNQEIRELLRAILSREGLSVECMAGGAPAVKRLEGENYDAILLDLAMPGTDGFDVLSQISKSSPGLLSRVMIITGLAPSRWANVDLSRVHGLIRKPFDVEELIRGTWSCIRGERPRSSKRRGRLNAGAIAAGKRDVEPNPA
jgi:CheY-like chemotaxis protein